MRTVIMSFVRGMEHGEQTLPTNDLFVYLPVQILPDLVVAMERQGFTPAEVKGGYGYRPKEEDAEDNPLVVVGVHTKDIGPAWLSARIPIGDQCRPCLHALHSLDHWQCLFQSSHAGALAPIQGGQVVS